MRKIVALFALMTVVVVAAPAAFAEGAKTTLSVKTWMNSWEISDSAGNSVDSDNTVLMIGPAVSVRLENNVFFGGSLLFTTGDYEFPYGDGTSATETISRTDLDLTIGYMFTPRFGAFVGYKSITGDYTDEWPASGIQYATGDLTMNGPGFGILANIPLSDTVALYGSLAWMFMDFEFTYSGPDSFENALYSSTDDVTGASVEIGLAFLLNPQTSINVGLKSQSFSGSDTDIEHSFAGLTAGLNYTF